MAQTDKDQTTYADPQSGEVPVAPRADIIRDNPYGSSPTPSAPNPAITLPTQVISSPMPSTPLSNEAYSANLIQNLGERKGITQAEADNQSAGYAEMARINQEAYQKQLKMLEGDPIKLHQAQEALAKATEAKDQKAMEEAQLQVKLNEGARPALLRAQVDAERRDNEIRQMIQDARKQQVDPDRWWNNKSTGGKVLAGIGLILGGFGGGLARTGRNPAMDVMNKAIDDDIKAQESNIKQNWQAIAAQHNLNQDTFNRELHRQVWENNYRTAALESVKFQLASTAAKTNSETVQNNAKQGILDITEQQLAIRNKQYNLALQAQAAERSRMRDLLKGANDDVLKLVEKEGVSPAEAERQVYGSPKYRELASAGLVPATVAADARLGNEAAAELAKQRKLAQTLGIAPGDPRYQQLMNVVLEDPKYQKLLTPQGTKPIVPVKGETIQKDTEELSKRLVQAKIPDLESSLNSLQQDYAPGGAGLKIGQAGFKTGMASPTGYGLLPGVSKEEKESLQNWQNMENHFIQAMTGAGMGVEEAHRYLSMARGDGSPEARQKGLQLINNKLNEVKTSIYAGHSPQAVQVYEQRKAVLPRSQSPSGVTAEDLNKKYGAK